LAEASAGEAAIDRIAMAANIRFMCTDLATHCGSNGSASLREHERENT
jgi:hypothetical protein